MPELPETETIARDLQRAVAGSRITRVEVRAPDVLREVTAQQLARRVAGRTITGVWRRAKLIVLDLEDGWRIVVQPRFTGALIVDVGNLSADLREYLAVSFALADGRLLHYRDVRRLGTVALMDEQRFQACTAALGPEPLDPQFQPAHLSVLLRGSRQAVKRLLMNQRQLAGVGNIYANEALWRAGIDPSRSASSLDVDDADRLHAALVAILTESIAARGTSFRDYRDASGNRGGFVSQLQAYGRGGAPCLRCGRRLIETHAIDGRSTVFCATCQH